MGESNCVSEGVNNMRSSLPTIDSSLILQLQCHKLCIPGSALTECIFHHTWGCTVLQLIFAIHIQQMSITRLIKHVGANVGMVTCEQKPNVASLKGCACGAGLLNVFHHCRNVEIGL